MLVLRNTETPPWEIWENTSSPFNSSTARAETKPTIASLPLILSGAGPLKAKTSPNFVLTLGVLGGGGKGVGVGAAAGIFDGSETVDGFSSGTHLPATYGRIGNC